MAARSEGTMDTDEVSLKERFFRYFQLGGNCIEGPSGLLAGVIRQPIVLIYHFFVVALLSIWMMYQDNGLLRGPVSFVQGFLILWKACVVLFPYIFAELKS